MYRNPNSQKVFNRRALLLGGGQAALFSALAARLYQLQVIEADRYAMLADENRINLRLLPPPRGRILDRDGEVLAVNRQNYRAVIVRERAPDLAATLGAFASIVPLTAAERDRVLRMLARKRPFVPVIIKENLSWEEVSRIAVNAPDLPGVTIEMGQSRHYPHGIAVAHALGYVAAVSDADGADDPLLQLPGFQIGRSGAEKLHDLALRGKAGSSQLEVNAVGRVIRELSREEGTPGAEVRLTLDLAMQKLATERLGGESAAAVVVDVETGEILTLVSTPGFDPEEFSRGLDDAAWKSLASDPRAPLANKAVAGQYAPGSTIKMIVALAAMEAGIASPDHRVFCTGEVELGTAKFHCWKKGGHGWMDMADSIAQSCDVYFYDIARKLGIDRIGAMARRFGLGAPLALDLPGEKPGLIPSRDWKRAVIGTPWQQGETLVAGIGQGFLLATPLQLAMMTARLVNGGRAVPPHLTRRPADAEAPAPATRIDVSAKALDFLRRAMSRVVNDPRGTAFGSRIADAGFDMGGKTGTSQVRRITAAERLTGVRKNEDLPWAARDHALFVGFAPEDRPRYAAAVVVEHGGSGSKAAAPVARDLLAAAVRRGRGEATVAGRGGAGAEG